MMLGQAAIAIDMLSISVFHRRKNAGAYNSAGRFVRETDPPPTDDEIMAAIQPVSGRVLRDLPEYLKRDAEYLLWTRQNVEEDDIITYRNREYRIMKIWPRDQAGFTRAIMGLLKP